MRNIKPEPIYLSQLCKDFNIKWYKYNNLLINDIEEDSRKVKPGMLFIALSGNKDNGKDYIQDAIANGAVAVIAESYIDLPADIAFGVADEPREIMGKISKRLWCNPDKNIKIIGITGTNGKTTTTFLLRSILQNAGYKTGIIGTTGIYYNDTYLESKLTTPSSLEINKYLACMKNAGVEYLIMEVSSHALIQKRVAHLNFVAGIFTNISRDHLNYHKTMENYINAKSILFENLNQNSYAILNYDDPVSHTLQKLTKAKLVYFSLLNQNSCVYAKNITLHGIKTNFSLIHSNKEENIKFSLLGKYNIYNALAAASCAFALNIDYKSIVKGLSEPKAGPPGRLECITDKKKLYRIFIDFAHTPQALESLLLTLKELKPGQLILVFGCGGERDHGKRLLMGEIASKYAHYSIITNDNPRAEDSAQIAREISRGFSDSSKYEICLDRSLAIKKSIEKAQKQDIIVIAGKGHEKFQTIGNKKIQFCDAEKVKKYLKDIYTFK